MLELFMHVYSCNALSARFFTVDRALNFYFMIMIMITRSTGPCVPGDIFKVVGKEVKVTDIF